MRKGGEKCVVLQWSGHEYRQDNDYYKKREENTYLRTHIIMAEATQHWILRKWDVIVPIVKHVRSMHNFRPSGKTEEAYI